MEQTEKNPCIRRNPTYASCFKPEFFGGKAELKSEGEHYYWIISTKDGRNRKVEINDNCICLEAEVLGRSYNDKCPLLFLGKDKETGKNFVHYVIYSSKEDKIEFDYRYDISNDDVYVLGSSMIGFYEEAGNDMILFNKNEGVYRESLMERNPNQDFSILKVDFDYRKFEPEIKIGFKHYGVNYVAILQFASNCILSLSAIMDENNKIIYSPEDKFRGGRRIDNFYYLKGILASEILKYKKKNEPGIFSFRILDQEHSYLDGKYKYKADVHGYLDTKTGAMVFDDSETRYYQMNDSLDYMFKFIKSALAEGKLVIDGYEQSPARQTHSVSTDNDNQMLLNMVLGLLGGNPNTVSSMKNYVDFIRFFSYSSYQEAKQAMAPKTAVEEKIGFHL